jgi:hypothetical protein
MKRRRGGWRLSCGISAPRRRINRLSGRKVYMIPVWFAAFCGGWAAGATALALWYARRERQARSALEALEADLPVVMLLGPRGVAEATLPVTSACYWLN